MPIQSIKVHYNMDFISYFYISFENSPIILFDVFIYL